MATEQANPLRDHVTLLKPEHSQIIVFMLGSKGLDKRRAAKKIFFVFSLNNLHNIPQMKELYFFSPACISCQSSVFTSSEL